METFPKLVLIVFMMESELFLKAYEYCVKCLPLEDALLKNCQFVNFEPRSTSYFGSVQRTIKYFHTISINVIKNLPLSDQLEEDIWNSKVL